jgi:RHS repeat-associated protein
VTATGTATPLNLAANANNQITTARFAYDSAGNETADATGSYHWNAEGQLTNAGGSTYTYDGDGRRVEKSNGKLYWYGLDGNVLDETDATGSVTNSAFSRYIYLNGRLVARRDQANAYYYFDDQLGSSRSLASVPAGTRTPTLCYEGDFYPYGAESIVTNTCPQNYKWTGKERDAETGNDDFDARYYSSTYGRFLSADWSAVPAPVPYANLTNPQTLNLYAIVRDNPETYADLDGHDPDVKFQTQGLEDMFNLIASESPIFNGELNAAKADHNMQVTVQDVGLQKMPEHAAGDAVVTINADGSSKVVINVRPTDQGTAEHEMGHEKDVRTNRAHFAEDALKDKKDKGGPNEKPHDERPVEQRANNFRDQVEKERKQHRKEMQEQKRKEKEKKQEERVHIDL